MIGRMARGFFDRLFDYEGYIAGDANASRDTSTGSKKVVKTDQTVDADGLLASWKRALDAWFDERDGVVSLGEFWALVADAKERSGLAWKAFERSVGVDSRASMPVKASELLSKMGYSFVYLKSNDGYLISLNLEEE
jgi:flavin-dependent dehydrogenase